MSAASTPAIAALAPGLAKGDRYSLRPDIPASGSPIHQYEI
jgi:hypothetical protein